ncbi:hypothetical protein TNCV_836711 [Trichonephila clavipes]|nr:hypothetical protein TNCV_836711 [Trichonephila clavipes]
MVSGVSLTIGYASDHRLHPSKINRHPEMMTRRKGLSPDENANLLGEFSENELDGGELSCKESFFPGIEV